MSEYNGSAYAQICIQKAKKSYIKLIISIFSCISVDAANYTLTIPKEVYSGRSLAGVLSVYYASPTDITIKITKDRTDLSTKTASVNGNGKLSCNSNTI